MKPRAYHEGVQATLDGTQVIFFTLQEITKLHFAGKVVPSHWWERALVVVKEAESLYESSHDPGNVG
jgi:hypothetical protein